MARDVGQEKSNLVVANSKVVGKVPAEIQRGIDLVADPVAIQMQRTRGQHCHLHLPTGLLVLLENTYGVPELAINAFKMLFTGLQFSLQPPVVNTTFNRPTQQPRPLLRSDKEICCA